MPSPGAAKAVDRIQQQLTQYAGELSYAALPAEVIHAAKVRVIDTLGALIGGFFGEPCRIARNVAAVMPDPAGATVIGTRMKTSPDMAAFTNAIAARYMEMNDLYHWPGTGQGHPSDAITPILAAAEHAHASGASLLAAVVLVYEVMLRISDKFRNALAFDHTNFACLGSAVGAGSMLGLTPDQMSHCISMAVVPNNCLRQVRSDQLSMFKAAASGQAGRAGVFAALLARAGMEGPHLPFEGKAGWCAYVAGGPFTLDTFGGNGTRFKILDTSIKMRASEANMISCIFAAEKIAPLRAAEIAEVTIEVYQHAMRWGTGEQVWNPATREDADHSIPFNVAAALIDGTVTIRTFDESHLRNPELRALMKKMKVVENPEFTRAYERLPQAHLTRVTVVTRNGERRVSDAGGDQDDISAPKSDAQIEQKFRGLTEDVFGARRAEALLDRLWHLDQMQDAAAIPAAFIIA